jgi:hypothetical protein
VTSSGGRHVHALEVQVGDAVEQPLARHRHHRRDVQAQLVDQALREVLVDRRGPARDRRWTSVRSVARLRP